jgi:hypothetical protein
MGILKVAVSASYLYRAVAVPDNASGAGATQRNISALAAASQRGLPARLAFFLAAN